MEAILINLLVRRIEIAIEQLQANQSLNALNTLKGALIEIDNAPNKK